MLVLVCMKILGGLWADFLAVIYIVAGFYYYSKPSRKWNKSNLLNHRNAGWKGLVELVLPILLLEGTL